MTDIYNPWRVSLENCISGDNYLRSSEYHELIDELDSHYQDQAFVYDLLWGLHPECCGQPAQTDHGMYGVEEHCCGRPEMVELNDTQIVASLRARFPAVEKKTKDQTT